MRANFLVKLSLVLDLLTDVWMSASDWCVNAFWLMCECQLLTDVWVSASDCCVSVDFWLTCECQLLTDVWVSTSSDWCVSVNFWLMCECQLLTDVWVSTSFNCSSTYKLRGTLLWNTPLEVRRMLLDIRVWQNRLINKIRYFGMLLFTIFLNMITSLAQEILMRKTSNIH